MGFSTNDYTVYDLLNDKLFIVAANQRKYVWTKNNWRELIEDIDLVYKKNTDKHFIGSIILKRETVKDGIKNHFSIIDGQQRISTLTIILCAMAFIFAENEKRDEFYGLEKQLFVTDNKRNPYPIVSEKANLSIAKLVCSLFDAANRHFVDSFPMVDFHTFINETRCAKVINDCFEYYYTELKKRTNGNMDILSTYRDILFEICYIDIIAEKEEDAYTIFEVLNARGQVLTDFELLRNYLLRYSDNLEKEHVKQSLTELEKMLGHDIEVFLKHYAMHKYGAKTDKNENRPYKVISNQEKSNIPGLLNDLMIKAGYYKKMTEYYNCSPLENKIFSFFKPRRQQQFRPLVMGMMHQKDLNNLSNEDYEKYLEYLYEFFICYYIIGEQTSNKIEDIVYGYSYKIENEFSLELLSRFQNSMAERIPNKTNFANTIKRIRYSHNYKAYSDNRKRENVFAIYELLERELGYEGSFENMSVEHCNPDSENEENAHIGNLMLLEKDLNENSCKNKPLAQKLGYYNESTLQYPKIIREKFIKDGLLDYEKNAEWIAGILFKRIKSLTLIPV